MQQEEVVRQTGCYAKNLLISCVHKPLPCYIWITGVVHAIHELNECQQLWDRN